jgi:hypothetical protein
MRQYHPLAWGDPDIKQWDDYGRMEDCPPPCLPCHKCLPVCLPYVTVIPPCRPVGPGFYRPIDLCYPTTCTPIIVCRPHIPPKCMPG